jgi:pimeloyl-ACP methyl ester carboxylesterase
MKAALLLAFALGACAPAFAADTPPANRYAATIVPAERFEVGSVLVDRHGQSGTPLILIPGLGSGAWAWQDTLRQFSGNHAVYVLTLAGFDGRAPVPGKALGTANLKVVSIAPARHFVMFDQPQMLADALGAWLQSL